ncbi:KAT8 regulatory NSL complex subunit 1-like protein [Spea bombifrons]|uniref:KAT8 regulatory NSL complex subunit 1-like protein n=1 Tax=Spea bombifrons TaxID=233779 RepID=UPI00234918BB|nr:KAT8 regulatory NSL complex subunit 1-like protein [Spea bombifrons]
MTPALTETATQGPEVHFSPSLTLRSLCSDSNLHADNSRAVEISLPKANGPSMVRTDTEQNHHIDFTSLKKIGSQCSPHYETVFFVTSSAALNLQRSGPGRKTEEQDTCRQMFYAKKDMHPLLMSMALQPEKKVKRELFPENMSQFIADVHNFWNITVTETQDIGGLLNTNFMLNGSQKEDLLAFPCASSCSSPDGVSDFSEDVSHKRSEINSRLLHCLKQQQALVNRAKRNQKRLQSLLANHAAEHCSQQIRCFVSHQMRNTKVPSTSLTHDDSHSGKDAESSSKVISDSDFKNGASPTMSADIRKFSVSSTEILGRIKQDLDSDVTESSSDEDWDGKAGVFQDKCNAEQKWLSVRASVGSRWVWLQAQISELEYKIQKLADIHREIRSTKGTVMLDKPSKGICRQEQSLPDPGALLSPPGRLPRPSMERNQSPVKDLEMSPSSPTLLLRNIEKQSAQLTEMVSSLMVPINVPMDSAKSSGHKRVSGGCPHIMSRQHGDGSVSLKGFCEHQQKKRKRVRVKASSAHGSSTSSCARARPLQAFQKRKLYRPSLTSSQADLALFSHKTLNPCDESLYHPDRGPTWTGCDKQESFALMNRSEIDPYFHPVISLPSDLPLNFRFDALLKQSDIKGEAVLSTLFTEEVERESSCVPESWNKYHTTCRPQTRYETRRRQRRYMSETEADSCISSTLESIKHAAPVKDVSPALQKSSAQRCVMRDSNTMFSASRRRLRSESSYDIDNIVIPMSLVAPTQLEKLQYKEIITPSWKVVMLEPLETKPDEELEDLSDEAFSCRHEKCERREKARWSFWEQSKWPKRSRSSSNGFNAWSGTVLPSSENSSSPSDLLPDPHNTHLTDEDNSQSSQDTDDAIKVKTEQWERRTFPMTEADTDKLLDKSEKQTPCALKSHLLQSPLERERHFHSAGLPMRRDRIICVHTRRPSQNREKKKVQLAITTDQLQATF